MKFQVLLVVLCKAAHTVASEVNVVRLETGLNPNAQGAAWAPQPTTHLSLATTSHDSFLVPLNHRLTLERHLEASRMPVARSTRRLTLHVRMYAPV